MQELQAPFIDTDFLVIGSGIAGLTFALGVADAGRVVLVTKKEDSESNTNYAQGGIAAVFGLDDSYDLHIQDTLRAGAGLCNEQAVTMMVEQGPKLVERLIEIGVEFSKEKAIRGAGRLSLGREGGHSRSRIVHAGDLTGREIERALLAKIQSMSSITVLENHLAVDLIVDQSKPGRCFGAYVLDRLENEIKSVAARATLLAAGGTGRVYLHTTNPPIATGDGIAMAFRAGASVANMEFVQFHPTTLFGHHVDDRAFLISEAVRGEGAVLKTKDGETFMERYHESGGLAPRDTVARAIDSELKRRGDEFVLLDLSPIGRGRIRERFPLIYGTSLSFGIDVTREPIPVVPGAHYCCGGIRADLDGHTDIEGLYACGECACTGVHGANRLASNSLLEALVSADRASGIARTKAFERDTPSAVPVYPLRQRDEVEAVVVAHNREETRRLMWDYVGIVRTDELLDRAMRRISDLKEEVAEIYRRWPLSLESIELRSVATVAELVARCAIDRKESRGLHWNEDHLDLDDKRWKRDSVIEGEARLPVWLPS
ncbi:L-aspartate oxidase [candidate division TA06 bacterium DG_24]|uniref:L-aspartate oxidase n=1 Tax=candidate division TA06 bacterium DG_24 TaxID=1703770 RepID=A0A0S7WVZ7_UNCT6|nr:MAG: L-aspartate oxidase [candidate division TA06 bacterium DG_24]